MRWGSSKTFIIIALFIGLLLLLVGIFYFKIFDFIEGFQTPAPASTKCACTDEMTNPGKTNFCALPTDPMGPENSDEQIAYDNYENFNLNDSNLTLFNSYIPTTNHKYPQGAALTPLDFSVNNEIPWDFDNKDKDPINVLWGHVTDLASQAIFTKCRCQALFSNINNLDFDPTAGAFQYQSALFNKTIYNVQDAAALQIGELYVNYYSEVLFEAVVEKVTAPLHHYFEKQDKLHNEAMKERAQTILYEVDEYKKLMNQYQADGLNKEAAKNRALAEIKKMQDNGDFDKKYREMMKTKLKDRDLTDFENYVKRADTHKNSYWKYGLFGIFKRDRAFDLKDLSAIADDVNNKDGTAAKLLLFADPSARNAVIADQLKKQNARRAEQGRKPLVMPDELTAFQIARFISTDKLHLKKAQEDPTILGDIFTSLTGPFANPIKTAYKFIKGNKITGFETKPLHSNDRNKPAEVDSTLKANRANKMSAELSRAAAIGHAQSAVLALSGVGILAAFIIEVIIFCCNTFIPILFDTLIDYDAQCPYHSSGVQYWNIKDAVENSSAFGGIGWSLMQNLPGIGSLLSGFGAYLCFSPRATTSEDWDKLIVLKQNKSIPPYFNDAALSLYNAGAMPGIIIEGGGGTADPRLRDPRVFHYGIRFGDPRESLNGPKGYPIWVDFAHPKMLDKMAQFYLDSSRKMLTTTPDGYGSYEYISRFYGLISTTELTCDVQCEIKQVKFDKGSGRKICEDVVPMPEDAASVYHDRRFYFYKDLKRGTGFDATDHTKQREKRITMDPDDRMEDNMKMYIVTGCTHVDETAPDATGYEENGESVQNPIVTLGPPPRELMEMTDPNRDTKYYPARMPVTPQMIPQSGDDNCGRSALYIKNRQPPRAQTADNNGGDVLGQEAVLTLNDMTADITKPAPWKFRYTDFRGNPMLPYRPYTTKYWDILWTMSCAYDNWDCRLEKNKESILTGTFMSLVGNLSIKGIEVGMLVQSFLSIDWTGTGSAQTLFECLWANVVNDPGTYVLNGKHIGSFKDYTIDFGPVVNFAPGYIPKLTFCEQEGLDLYDCVNRYSVRKFVNTYHNQYPDRQIKRIHNIVPRGTNKLGHQLKDNTWCIYNIDYANFDSEKFMEMNSATINENVGIQMTQQITDRTCAYTHSTITVSTSPTVEGPWPPSQLFYLNPEAPKFQHLDITGATLQNGCIATKVLDINFPKVAAVLTVTAFPANARYIQESGQFLYFINSAGGTIEMMGKDFDTGNPTPVKIVDYNDENTFGNVGSYRLNVTEITTPPPGQTVIMTTGQRGIAAPGVTYNIRIVDYLHPPDGCTNKQLRCSDTQLQIHLIDNFNRIHDKLPEIKGSILGTDSITIYTAKNELQCLYKNVVFDRVYNPENGKYTSVTQNLGILLKPSQKAIETNSLNKCLYDISVDTFRLPYYYTPVPKKDRWLDIPARTLPSGQSIFKRSGCPDNKYSDCSNSEIIANLVGNYNLANTNTKILQVNRAYTVALGPTDAKKASCDYAVQMVRTVVTGTGAAARTDKYIENETIRFFLKDTVRKDNETIEKCLYDMDRVDTTLNSGTTLNTSQNLGILTTPYVWPTSYVTTVISSINGYLLNYISYNIPKLLDSASKDGLTTVKDIRNKMYKAAHLKGCPGPPPKKCDNISAILKDGTVTVQQALINRFNFDNYPPYANFGIDLPAPDGRKMYYPIDNTIKSKKTIVAVNKIGTATNVQCHLECIIKNEFFIDFLYRPTNRVDLQTSYNLVAYEFIVIPDPTTPCQYKVKPFTIFDISNNTMDLSGEAYALQGQTGVQQYIMLDETLIPLPSPLPKVSSRAPAYIDSPNPVLSAVATAYNNIVIPTGATDGRPYHNTLLNFRKAFHAKPNVIEFKIDCKHVYFDDIYKIIYYTGGDVLLPPDESFIVATWAEGVSYEVDTGYYYKVKVDGVDKFCSADTQDAKICMPTIEEFYFPDLSFPDMTTTTRTSLNGKGRTEKIALPYLANDCILYSQLDTVNQPKRYVEDQGRSTTCS